jgi:guanosine-3',5'-bis(diphosphate) 3'-pyrophosphohydrolase
VEIQIRTHDMHQVAEGGIAAHWKYKEGKFDSRSRENMDWVHRLLEWNKDLSDPNEFLETVKIDLFAEDVFVFTPKGEVRQLSHGSTPLDFAYAVHTDVGNKCVGAKVNGKIVPLRHRLKSGDTVEVITSPTQTPSKDWLKIVKSSRAKAKIRAVIKAQERGRALELGKEMLDKALRGYSLTLAKVEKSGDLKKLIEKRGHRTADELFIFIGYGRLDTDQIIPEFVPKEAMERKLVAAKNDDQSFLKKVFTAAKKRSESRNAIIVENLDDVLIRFGRCCHPLPGDSIIGFITRGRGVTVHTGTCTKALDNDQERRVEVQWNRSTEKGVSKRHVKIRVLSLDEPGLLALMSQTISACGVNITSANIRTTKDKKAIALFDVEVGDLSQLQKVTSALESKRGVITVERVRS